MVPGHMGQSRNPTSFSFRVCDYGASCFPALSFGPASVTGESPAPSPLPPAWGQGGGGRSLAVRGELEVVRAHLEEVQEVRAAGDLGWQGHERAAVLGERALAALGGPLPVEPPRS